MKRSQPDQSSSGNAQRPNRGFRKRHLGIALIIFIAISVTLHVMFVGGTVVENEVVNLWHAHQARLERERLEAQRLAALKAKEEAKKQAAKKNLTETKQAIAEQLHSEFKSVVGDKLSNDAAEKLWNQVLSKLTASLDDFAQSANANASDQQIRDGMTKVQQEMLDDMLAQLKQLTAKQLADSFVSQVSDAVAPKLADYYNRQIHQKIANELNTTGSSIMQNNAQTTLQQRRAVATAVSEAASKAKAAESALADAHKSLQTALENAGVKSTAAATTNPAAGAKTPGNDSSPLTQGQRQRLANAVKTAQNAIDRANDNLNAAAKALSNAQKNAGALDGDARAAFDKASGAAASNAQTKTQQAGNQASDAAKAGNGVAASQVGNLADAAKSAEAAASHLGDALKAAQDAAGHPNEQQTMHETRVAVKNDRGAVAATIDKEFQDKVADVAIPRLSDKLSQAFSQTLGDAGIADDPKLVADVNKRIGAALRQQVKQDVNAGKAGLSMLNKSQQLDDVHDSSTQPSNNSAQASKDSTENSGKHVPSVDGVDSNAMASASGNDASDNSSDNASNAANSADGANSSGSGKHSRVANNHKASQNAGSTTNPSDATASSEDAAHKAALERQRELIAKLNQAARDLASAGMSAIGADGSGDAALVRTATGNADASGAAGTDGGDGGGNIGELTQRVAGLAAGMRSGRTSLADAGADGAGGDGGDGDENSSGSGAAGGGAAGGGNGGHGGMGGAAGSGPQGRPSADGSRDGAASLARFHSEFHSDQYLRLTSILQGRNMAAAQGQAIDRRDAAAASLNDPAAIAAALADRVPVKPAVELVPPPTTNPMGIPQKTEPYQPTFKTIRFAAIPYRSKPITLDGDLSEWADIPSLPMRPEGLRPNLRVADQTVKACWDNTGFYLAFNVIDADNNIAKADPHDFWDGDGIEIEVDPLNTKEKDRTELTQQFWAWVAGGGSNPQFVGGEAIAIGAHRGNIGMTKDQIQVASKKTAEGWTMEVHIPVERFHKINLAPGVIMGMNITINTGTNLCYHWAGDDNVQTSMHPSTWGDVLLAGSDGKLECVDKLDNELKHDEDAKPLTVLQIGQPLKIRVTDADMNLSDAVKDRVAVSVGTGRAQPHTVILEETGEKTGIFEGSIPTMLDTGDDIPGVLSLFEGEKATITYTDLCRPDGARNVPVKLTIPTAASVTGAAAR